MKCIGIFDIDGTLTNIDRLYSLYSNSFTKGLKLDINIQRRKNLIFRIMKSITENYTLRANAPEVIRYLKKLGLEINFVTRRFLATEETKEGIQIRCNTEIMMIDNDIPFDNIIFTSGSKLDECKILNADFIVEDEPENILYLSQFLPVIVMTTPYNKSICGKNIYRVNNWIELKELIEQKFIKQKVLDY